MELIIPILNSLNYILVLIMVAMGLVIIFGLMRVINMAHGEFFLIGAYTVVMTEQFGFGFWVGLILSPIVVGLFGMIMLDGLRPQIFPTPWQNFRCSPNQEKNSTMAPPARFMRSSARSSRLPAVRL